MLLVHLLAQAAAAAAPEAAAQPQQGVISYPAAYFADQQPANAADMIQRVPGFSLDRGASVRGFEGAAGNVLIDGRRPASKTDDLESILRRMPAGQVERIDVIRGGAPGIDMQGKTVIANVIRKKGGSFRAMVAGSQNHIYDGRTSGAVRVETSGGWGDRKWELAAVGGKGIDDGAGEGPGVRVLPDGQVVSSFIDSEGDGANVNLTGVFETPLAGGHARINGRFAPDKFKYEEDNVFLSPTPGLETTDDVYKTTDTEIGANYSRPLNGRTTLELVGLRQTRDRTITSQFAAGEETSRFALDRESSETIGRAVLKYRFDDRLSFEGGAETALNRLDSATAFTINGAPIPLPAGEVQVEELRSEAFVKSAWRPTDAWTVDAALRYESSKITSEGDVLLSKTLHFAKPRVAVAWSVRPATQLRLRIEREVGQLNFNDFVAQANLNTGSGVTAGNPDLDPQQAWVGEAALEQRFWGSGVAVLTFRHFELKDAVDRAPIFAAGGSVFDAPANIGDGTKDELALETTLPLDRVGVTGGQLKGEVTRRWSTVTDPTTGGSREISGLRPLDWSANFTQDLPQWRMSWGVDAYGGWRETYYRFNLIETVKLKTYVRPFLEWRPVADINIRFELPNVTSRGLRRTIAIYPGPRSDGGEPIVEDRDLQFGRMYYVRVRKTFGG